MKKIRNFFKIFHFLIKKVVYKVKYFCYNEHKIMEKDILKKEERNMKNKKSILLIIGWILLCLLSFYCLKDNVIGSYFFLVIVLAFCIYYAIKNRNQVFSHYKMGIGLTVLACILAPHHYLRSKWYTMARNCENIYFCRHNFYI